MNKVINASIAGIGFGFDPRAYEELRGYLDRLNGIFRDNPDGEEITADIEARIVEIILSQQSAETVVSEELIHSVIERMGMPESDSVFPESSHDTDAAGDLFPRRFYRSREGAKIGGVCSGLGTYLDVDPVWIRVGIFIPVILLILSSSIGFNYMAGFLGALFGSVVLLYFILWFAVPLARTPRQRLEMRGEKITASSIQRNMTQEMSVMSEGDARRASVFGELMTLVGRVLLFFVKLFVIFVGFALALAAIGLIVAMFSVILSRGLMINGHELAGLADWLQGISPRSYVSITISLALIPIIMLVYLIVGLVFKLRINRAVMWILGGLWIVLLIYWGVVTVRTLNLKEGEVNIEKIWEGDLHTYGNPPDGAAEVPDMDGNPRLLIVNGDTIIGKSKEAAVKEDIKVVKVEEIKVIKAE